MDFFVIKQDSAIDASNFHTILPCKIAWNLRLEDFSIVVQQLLVQTLQSIQIFTVIRKNNLLILLSVLYKCGYANHDTYTEAKTFKVKKK